MKITNHQLKQIIKEELEKALSEAQSEFHGHQYLHKYQPMQDQLVYALRERGFNANPSERPQVIRIKGRDGKVVEFYLAHHHPNDFRGALEAAIQQINDADADMSMRRKASQRRMGQGIETVSVDDPTMEQ